LVISPVVILATAGVVALANSRREGARAWVVHTADVIAAGQATLAGIVEAEAAQRGYLLTQEPHHLNLYSDGLDQAAAGVRRMRALTSDNRRQQRRLDTLDALVTAKRASLDSAISQDLRDSTVARVAALEAGQAISDSIRSVLGRINGEERGLLAVREADDRRSSRSILWIAFACAALASALTVLTNRLLSRAVDAERRSAEQVQLQALRLEQAGAELHGSNDELRKALEQLAAAEQTAREEGATAQRRLEELQVVYDAAPVGLSVLDRELRFVRINTRLAALNGLPVDAHIGRSIREVLPELAGTLEAIGRGVLATGEPVLGVEVVGETPAAPGVRRTWAESWYPLRDTEGVVVGVNVVVEDITDRRAREEQLSRRNREFEALATNTPDVIARFDRQLRHRYVNPAGQRLTGLEMPELVGRSNRDLGQPAEFVDRWEHAIREVFRTGVGRQAEFEFVTDAGRYWYQTRFEPERNTAGEIETVLAVSRDVTAQRQAEEQVRHMQRLEVAGRLAGGVAHEINNQLTAVLGFQAFVLREGGLDERSAADLAEARRAAERAASITRQLLAFSRRQLLRPETFDLAELLRETGATFVRLLGSQVRVEVDIRPPGPCYVHMDRAQLAQVLLNLALNARDAMPKGGTLTVQLERRRVDASELAPQDGGGPRASRYWYLHVRDTGVGMASDILERAFEPFFTTKPVGSGTGLGLAVAHGIVTQSGGYIWAESSLGAGTTVSLLLPAADAGVPADGGAPSESGQPARAAVLVVEDEPSVRAVAVRALGEAGFRVVEAAHGREALELVSHANGNGSGFAALVTDLMMPVMNGRELADRLLGALALPVLYMSGHPMEEMVSRGLLEGGEAFLAKPFTPEALVAAVESLVLGAAHPG
jgi:PAS domain S-box-containing protein